MTWMSRISSELRLRYTATGPEAAIANQIVDKLFGLQCVVTINDSRPKCHAAAGRIIHDLVLHLAAVKPDKAGSAIDRINRYEAVFRRRTVRVRQKR